MIKKIKGNIFEVPTTIICHQVNCKGVMGSGLALQIKQKYYNAYQAYKDMCTINNNNADILLGQVQLVNVSSNLLVANCFAQKEFGHRRTAPYTSYEALDKCFNYLNDSFKNTLISVPYGIGCGLGGGRWGFVEKIIESVFTNSTNTCLIVDFN